MPTDSYFRCGLKSRMVPALSEYLELGGNRKIWRFYGKAIV